MVTGVDDLMEKRDSWRHVTMDKMTFDEDSTSVNVLGRLIQFIKKGKGPLQLVLG